MKALSTTIAAACLLAASSISAQAENITLDVSVPITSEQKAMHEALTAEFAKQHPEITIKLDMTSRDYEDLVQRNMRQAITGGLPDVVFHVYNRVPLLAERGLPQPLDSFVKSENMTEQGYMPSILSLAQVGDHYYGLPFNTSTIVVYYNKSLLAQVGADPNNLPKTWAEITALSAKIQGLGNGVSGLYYDYYETSGNWTFISLLESLGGSMMSPDNKSIAFDQAPGMKALEVLRDIGRSGFVDMTKAQARQSFAAGKLGIFVVSTSYLKELTDGANGKFELGVGSFPIVESGHLPAGGNAVMMLTKDPEKQKAAWEYIKFVSGPIGQTLVARNSGYMPNNTIAVEKPELLGDFYKENPNSMVSIQQLKYLHGFYAFPGPNSLKISDVIRDHLRDVITLQQTPEQVMPEMVRDVQSLLPQS